MEAREDEEAEIVQKRPLRETVSSGCMDGEGLGAESGGNRDTREEDEGKGGWGREEGEAAEREEGEAAEREEGEAAERDEEGGAEGMGEVMSLRHMESVSEEVRRSPGFKFLTRPDLYKYVKVSETSVVHYYIVPVLIAYCLYSKHPPYYFPKLNNNAHPPLGAWALDMHFTVITAPPIAPSPTSVHVHYQ